MVATQQRHGAYQVIQIFLLQAGNQNHQGSPAAAADQLPGGQAEVAGMLAGVQIVEPVEQVVDALLALHRWQPAWLVAGKQHGAGLVLLLEGAPGEQQCGVKGVIETGQ